MLNVASLKKHIIYMIKLRLETLSLGMLSFQDMPKREKNLDKLSIVLNKCKVKVSRQMWSLSHVS